MIHRTPQESFDVIMDAVEELVVRTGGVLDVNTNDDLIEIGRCLGEALGVPNERTIF